MEIKPLAWSHSRVDDFKKCPRMLYHKAVLKDCPFESSPAAEEGKRVHKILEDRISKGTPLQGKDVQYEGLAAAVLRTPGQALTEVQLTLTQALTATGWFAKDAWCRVQVDVMKVNGDRGWAGDWKTGKVSFDEHQLKLTAAAMMTLYQELNNVTTTYIWLRDNIVEGRTYTRSMLASLWDELLVKPMQMQECNTTNIWPATPSKQACRFCPVNKLGKCAVAACAPYTG